MVCAWSKPRSSRRYDHAGMKSARSLRRVDSKMLLRIDSIERKLQRRLLVGTVFASMIVVVSCAAVVREAPVSATQACEAVWSYEMANQECHGAPFQNGSRAEDRALALQDCVAGLQVSGRAASDLLECTKQRAAAEAGGSWCGPSWLSLRDIPSCQQRFGARPVGASCAQYAYGQCATGACAGNGKSCGVCVDAPKNGQRCSGSCADPRSICRAPTYTCQPLRPRSEGTAGVVCQNYGGAPDIDCAIGHYCDFDSVNQDSKGSCRSLPMPGAGSICRVRCAAGLLCTNGVCETQPSKAPQPSVQVCGEITECPRGNCIDDACMGYLKNGEACTRDSACGPYLFCNNGVCKPSTEAKCN
jgi:hypothetical protein